MTENLAAKKELIAAIEAYQLSGDQEADLQAMHDFQAKWREIGFIPYKEKDKVQAAYRDALKSIFGDMVSEGRPRRASFQDRGRSAAPRQLSERDRLIQKYTQLEQDIVTWENNLGFFEKSKGAEALISDFRSKIEEAKKDLAALHEQIKSLAQAEQTQE